MLPDISVASALRNVRREKFRFDYAYGEGRPVTEGHRLYCRESSHVASMKLEEPGRWSPRAHCSRCGDRVDISLG